MHFIFRLKNLIGTQDAPLLQIKGAGVFKGSWPEDLIAKREHAIKWLGRRYVNHPEYDPRLRGGLRFHFEEGKP